MHADKSIERILLGVTTRYNCRKKNASRELTKRNQSSCAPTKDYLILHGQSLVDTQYDAIMSMFSAQIARDTFLAWNFETKMDPNNYESLFLTIPEFLRVRILTVNEDKNENGGEL